MRIRTIQSTAVLTALSIPLVNLPTVSAQESVDDFIDEIIVTGTRRPNRTVADSAVPIDVFKGEEVRNIGTDDMDDVLRTLVPAYNVERLPLDDEASLIRPATLRGLPPDNTLVLINGKRRHRGAVLAGGSQGADMSTLPAMAVQRVEVLRDGASAQYGSDAIAGVINYIMRDSAEGLTLEYKVGEFYEGDGRSDRFSANLGLPLGEDGALNLSAEYGTTDSTTRSEQRFDARALQDLGVTGIPDPVQTYGQPIIDPDIKFFANAVYDIGENSELYAFGNYSTRDVAIQFFWRNPNSLPNIYNQGPERFVLDLTPDMSGNCPLAGTPNSIPVPNRFFPTQEEVDANELALAALAADPNCYAFTEFYPDGFRPDYGGEIEDWSTVAGFRGERDSGLRYDFSAGYGTNDITYFIHNTLNPSLGPDSPTSFQPGANAQSETNLNADFGWQVDVDAFSSPLYLAAGLEWREETFETRAGDRPSWEAGPYFLQGASIGSNGYPGFSPEQAGSWDRANWAAYFDAEADVTDKLLIGLAIRYEDFDDFGDTTNYKAAVRYWFNDRFSIRSSVSTGFRAPTPGQLFSTRTQTIGFEDGLANGGRIPPTNPVAAFYGGQPLEPEESENLSAGFTWQPFDSFLITADYFRIDVENGMGVSPDIGITPEDVQELIDLGVPGASDFLFINFFVNGVETRRDGFDIVATYSREWQRAGTSSLSLAWNRTEVEVRDMEFPSRQFAVDLEGRPTNRAILTYNHNWNDFRFLVRASYYDDWVDAGFGFENTLDNVAVVCADRADTPPTPPGTDECYGDSWMVDIEAAYTFADRYTVVVGADNVFDEYPEEDYDYPDFSFGARYPRASPIGYNGGFWYVRLRAEFF